MNEIVRPAVSVIIPVYNVEKYLEECLDSVLSQTLRNIEVICVDDGSTDRSCDILAKQAETDGRIIVKHQINTGSGPARNCALSMSSGQYISFMDADDLYPDPDILEQLYRCAITHKTKITGGYRMVLKDQGPQVEPYDLLYKLSDSTPPRWKSYTI